MAIFFSKNLKFIRNQKNISQQELADKLMVDRSTISKWENNNMIASIDSIVQICDVLDISIADLIGKDLKAKEEKSFDEIEFLLKKNKDILTKDDKELIKFIIKNRKKSTNKNQKKSGRRENYE